MLNKPKENKFKQIFEYLHAHIIAVIVIVVVIASIVSGILIVTGKVTSSSSSDSDKKYEDQSVLYFSMHNLTTLNPLTSADEDVFHITQLLYSSLFKFDKNLSLEPDLVESYTTDASSGTVSITLKSNVKFSNGTGLTAEDVKFTVNEIKDIGKSSPYYSYASKISRVTVSSNYKLTIKFENPSDAALDNLVFPIVFSNDYNTKTSYKPIGTGPYKYSSYDSTQSLTLAPNTNYYGTVPTNTIEFEILPSDSNITGLITTDRITAYLNKSMDADSDAKDKSLNFEKIQSNEMEYLAFNFKNAYLSKESIRKAVATAIDKEAIIADSYGGNAVESDSIYFPGFLGIENKSSSYTYNQSKAIKLLKKGGLSDINEDGKLEDEEKNTVTLRILVNSNDTSRVSTANAVADDLKAVGIQTKIENVSRDEYDKKIKNGDFDILLGGYKFDPRYDLRALFNSSNSIGYSDEEVLSYANKLETSMTIEDEKKTYETLKEKLNNSLPYYCICYKTYGFVTVKKFTSEELPTFFSNYNGCETWKWQRKVK